MLKGGHRAKNLVQSNALQVTYNAVVVLYSRYGAYALYVGPGGRCGRVLRKFVEQEIHQFEEETVVATHHQVADGDNGSLAHGETRTRELREQRLLYGGVEGYQ